MNQTEKQSIEALAVKLLMEIEQHTTVCIGDLERNIFLQGVNAGYNAALESYKDGWVSSSFQCHHNFVQKDSYWRSCTHCGMLSPLGQ